MPKERFFNLLKDKKDKIMKAAISELARVPFEEASINKIIKEASISRGSFYTYFDDKQDLIHYLFENIAKSCEDFCIKSIQRNYGDIFSMMEETLDFAIGNANNDTFKFYRNLLMNIKLSDHLVEMNCPTENNIEEFSSRLYQLTDTSHLNVKDEKEFKIVVDILTAILFKSIAAAYWGICPAAQIKNDFQSKIELIKKGICK